MWYSEIRFNGEQIIYIGQGYLIFNQTHVQPKVGVKDITRYEIGYE